MTHFYEAITTSNKSIFSVSDSETIIMTRKRRKDKVGMWNSARTRESLESDAGFGVGIK